MRAQAQQIIYTVLRLAPYVRRKELRVRLEEVALNCFVAAGLGNASEVERHAEALLGLVQLSKSLYEIELINGDMLIGALRDLVIIAKAPELKKTEGEKPDVAELLNEGARLFSNRIADRSANVHVDRQVLPIVRQEEPDLPNVRQSGSLDNDDSNAELDAADSEFEEDRIATGGMISIGNAIRQSAILEKIKAMNVRDARGEIIGCRMKDLLAAFPGVSERTLRNDLQRLVNQEKIGRIGAGGFSVYVIK
jgi:hypothetical protein